jgi:hypothetical protein
LKKELGRAQGEVQQFTAALAALGNSHSNGQRTLSASARKRISLAQKKTMGGFSQGIEASGGSHKAHDVSISPQEDRSRTKTALGEGAGEAEESRVKIRFKNTARSFGGGLFSLTRIIGAWRPDELGNTFDHAEPHGHTVCSLPKTRSAMPRKRTETLPPNS